MKNLVIILTLAIVAIQLSGAAPVPENEKQEAAASPAAPAEVANASPRGAEVKVEEVGVIRAGPEATPWLLRDGTSGPNPVKKSE